MRVGKQYRKVIACFTLSLAHSSVHPISFNFFSASLPHSVNFSRPNRKATHRTSHKIARKIFTYQCVFSSTNTFAHRVFFFGCFPRVSGLEGTSGMAAAIGEGGERKSVFNFRVGKLGTSRKTCVDFGIYVFVCSRSNELS